MTGELTIRCAVGACWLMLYTITAKARASCCEPEIIFGSTTYYFKLVTLCPEGPEIYLNRVLLCMTCDILPTLVR